jgi:hypothetical protein
VTSFNSDSEKFALFNCRLRFTQLMCVLGCLLLTFPGLVGFAQKQSAKVVGKRPPAHSAVPDIAERLAKLRPVKMPLDEARLTAKERQLVEKLVDACRDLENIYWRQSDPEGLALYRSLATDQSVQAQQIRRMLMVNGSRFDLLEENQPFVGNDPFAPGRALYPKGLTREQIEKYVTEHPEKKAEIYNPFTVVKRRGDQLVGVPYHVEYQEFLAPAAQALRDASKLSDDPKFAEFLRLRATALLTDDYYQSDLAWLDLNNPKFDIIFAPYETYLDDVLGVKTSYGASVLIRNEEESSKLAVFQKFVPDIQDALPISAQDRPSKHGHLTPMEVMDAPYRAGDLRHGYQAVADNLPNDPRIHQEKGSKKIFFKNFMDARVNNVVLPIAKRLMLDRQASQASADGYLAGVMMHEISHELGPAFARRDGKQVAINEAIGPVYSALEEAKADVVGMFGLKWLVDRGALPKERLEEYYASYVAGLFRTVRFGVAEAHGRAQMMEFNYLIEQKAITRDEATNRYVVDYAAMPAGLERVAKELLEIEATGDRPRAEAWFAKYDKMPETLKVAFSKTTEVPVDIVPEFFFADRIR